MNRRFAALPLVLAAAALTLAGCSSSPSDASTTANGKLAVVASTNVWGSVAEAIGGTHVAVTSIIDDPDKDPHEYQADAQNQLAISKARVVVENGGGYDDFVDALVKASGNKPTVLNAANISGYDQNPADGEFNEHVWYDFPTVGRVAQKIETAFVAKDAANKAAYSANLDAFDAKLTTLKASEAKLKQRYQGEGAAITEPVPLYMLDAIGLKNKTPEKFSEAIENGTDVAPMLLQQTTALFSDKAVKVLAYNEQTSGAQTEALLTAAKENDVPVVPVAETLPSGKNYVSWMTANVAAIGSALAK